MDPKHINILLVDDDEDDYMIVRDLLSEVESFTYDLEWASTYAAGLEAAQRQNHDVYLLDYRLGEHTGLDLLRMLAAKGCNVPIILLTGQGDHEIDLQAMKAGAADYLVKAEISGPLLERSIRYALERKQTEESLRTERDKAQRYLDIAGVMLVALGKDEKVTLINKKGGEILGFEEHEILGKNWFDLCVPETVRENVRGVFNQLMAGQVEPVEYYENPVLTRNGSERLIAWHNTLLKDEQGNITGALSSGEDITDKKRAEQVLRDNQKELLEKHRELEQLFRQVESTKKEWEATMDCIGDMVFLTDDMGKIKRCNQAVTKFTAQPYEELWNLDWKDLIHDHKLKIQRVLSQGMELFHDPTRRWFSLKSYPFRNFSRLGSGTVITIHETTELKRMTEELEVKGREIDRNREKLQSALNEIVWAIEKVTLEKEFDIRLANPALQRCYEVMDCTKEECPCHGQDAMRCWQTAGTYCCGETQGEFAKKFGNCLECRVFKTATPDPVHQIGEQFNNMMHILETKNKALLNAYSELKTTQAAVIQQDKMASIGQLAAGVAHEINNPIGFITSNLGTLHKYVNKFIELIQAQSEAVASLDQGETSEKLQEQRKQLKIDYIMEDVQELIRECLDGAEQVKRIVQDLKSFSRVDQAEHKLADINECLETTINIIQNELKYKTTLTKDYGQLPLTKCYPQQLNQVFMNLLVNSAQAIEKHGEITIKTLQENGSIRVSISDTGSGIPEDKLDKIFEPFFTTKDVGEGTGLGLSISYDIVKKHNGDIKVRSQVGKGTTFDINLPVVDETEPG